ncbi:B9 domain-containing protein 2 [Gaertneriomyces sp. JEL0708]|nr:B9 domain-containing protein 2 [Gaertneriomyces sp. JEL0708]
MAELHVVGTLLGASKFPNSSLCCRWRVIAGDGWRLLEGDNEGMTQVDVPNDSRFTTWSHPLDLHYATKSITGWPKIQLQVYYQDNRGRNQLYGYGFAHIPTTPGLHAIEVPTWRPYISWWDEFWSYFMDYTPTLKNTDMIHEPTDRFRLTTCSMGKVHLEIGIILRNFEGYGVAM